MLQSPPHNEQELLRRADTLAGESIAQLAGRLDLPLATNLNHHKGWVGHLIEKYLGAQAGSQPKPDFPELGIELKTIPLNNRSSPRESTFLCAINLKRLYQETWQTSLVYKKITRILWIPVEGDPKVPLGQRRVGTAILWSPTQIQKEILRSDWCALTDRISMGELETITAAQGRYLQVRPKGANGKSLCWGVGKEGELILTLPRGFYLRTLFTQQIINANPS